MANPVLELRREGRGVALIVCPAGFSSFCEFCFLFCFFLFFVLTQNKGLGSGPPGPSARSATDIESFTVQYCGLITLPLFWIVFVTFFIVLVLNRALFFFLKKKRTFVEIKA